LVKRREEFGIKVLLDSDLAELYQAPTMRLNEQIKRNPNRFPEDFMFQLSKEEYKSLISQIAISSLINTNPLDFSDTLLIHLGYYGYNKK
jgi:hypothetical protein